MASGSPLSPDAPSCSSRKESEQLGVRTAEKLLREFHPHTAWGQTQLQLLQGLCLLATKEKANMEAALGTFIQMAQVEVRRTAGRGTGGGVRAGRGADGMGRWGVPGADAGFPPSPGHRGTACRRCWPWRRPTCC